MKRLFKGLAWGLLGLVIVAAYPAYRLVWGHPFTINQLANRQVRVHRHFTAQGLADDFITWQQGIDVIHQPGKSAGVAFSPLLLAPRVNTALAFVHHHAHGLASQSTETMQILGKQNRAQVGDIPCPRLVMNQQTIFLQPCQ